MICPFRGQPCQHPDWADCQFQFAGYEDECVKLWLAGEDDKMGKNCSWLPDGISRTEMLAVLGAFGEEEKARVLERVAKRSQEKMALCHPRALDWLQKIYHEN